MRHLARTAFVLTLFIAMAPADARKPEDVFKGQIILLKKPLPSKFKSEAAFIAEVKRSQIPRNEVWPVDKTEKTWKIEYAAFFANPLNDVEADLKFYDITDPRRPPRFVHSDGQYTSKRGERVLFNSFTLEKSDDSFKANKKYLMQLVSKKKIIADAKFWLRGKVQQFSGKVNFSDEDTKKKDEE
jgi:hypothetical protein